MEGLHPSPCCFSGDTVPVHDKESCEAQGVVSIVNFIPNGSELGSSDAGQKSSQQQCRAAEKPQLSPRAHLAF